MSAEFRSAAFRHPHEHELVELSVPTVKRNAPRAQAAFKRRSSDEV